MRLLVVLPFCEGDQKLLLGLLGWIKDLGTLDNDCVIVFSRNTNPDLVREVADAASLCFKSVRQIPTPHSIGDESWPKGPNFLFATAAQHIQSARLGAWLWMEPDCVPTCEGWLSTLEKAYDKYGKPFMGPRLDPYKKVPGLAGCSVYPEDAYTRLKSLFPGVGVNKAWDVTCGKITEGVGQVTRLITHWWGQRNRPPTFKAFRTRLDMGHCKSIDSIPKMCVLFHRCKDGTLIDLFRRIAKHSSTLPKIFHVTEVHQVLDRNESSRIQRAIASWSDLYKTGSVIPCHLRNPKRTARGIGDSRNLPYLRELLELGMEKAEDNDIIMLTNDDSLLHPELPVILMATIARQGAVSSFRLNVLFNPRLLERAPEKLALEYQHDHGRDLFAFSKAWLKTNWNRIPDMLLGEWEWDLVMSLLIRDTVGIQTPTSQMVGKPTKAELPLGYLLHEKHKPRWQHPSSLMSPGKLWNRNQAKAWYSSEHLEHLFTL